MDLLIFRDSFSGSFCNILDNDFLYSDVLNGDVLNDDVLDNKIYIFLLVNLSLPTQLRNLDTKNFIDFNTIQLTAFLKSNIDKPQQYWQ